MYCTLNWTLFCFCATCQSVTSRSREFPVPGILLLFGSYRYRYRKKLVPEKSTGTGKKSGYCHTLPPGQRTVICYNVMCFTGGARVRSVTAELPSCQTALSPRAAARRRRFTTAVVIYENPHFALWEEHLATQDMSWSPRQMHNLRKPS